MLIIKKKDILQETVSKLRESNSTIGFVPTMGALHKGHISLIDKCKKENNICIASIFVNPAQFNNKNDLLNYPRTEENDIKMLKAHNCDIVFMPAVKEMYPENDMQVFDFGRLGELMEGKHRPGHFIGVGKIVYKFFETIMPDNAYFGRKDFQQLAIIKYLIKIYMPDSGIVVKACDIIRDPDGLAVSSRNMRLNKNEKKASSLISKTLFKYSEQKNIFPVDKIKENVVKEINANPYLEVEYFEIVDNDTLESVSENKITNNMTGCIAVFAGNIRLIDNVSF